jgi:hemerythrin-like domain-containing protein
MTLTSLPTITAVADLVPAEFEALDACHQQVLSTLRVFGRLVDHLDQHGLDATARAMATEVIDFFATTARQHHAEEEEMVFPPLLLSSDAELVHQVQRLQQDHGWLEENWIELAPQLKAVSEGYNWFDLDYLRPAVTVFTELYLDHLDLEESMIYPEAKRVLSLRAQAGIGRKLALERQAAAAA